MEPQVTALRVLKNLNYMNLQELVATLKVHGQEIKKDEEFKKGKFVALSTQTERKTPSSKESSSRPSSKSVYKALSVEYFSVVEFKEESDEDDELAFIARKIRKMWKNKNGSRWKNFSKKVFKEKKDTRKSSIICTRGGPHFVSCIFILVFIYFLYPLLTCLSHLFKSFLA